MSKVNEPYFLNDQSLTLESIAQEGTQCCNVCDNTGRDIETVCLDDLVEEIRPYTAYSKNDVYMFAPDDAIRQQLGYVLQDFTKRSRVLKRRFRTKIQAGLRDYYVQVVEGEKIDMVESVCVAGICLQPNRNGNCCESKSCKSFGGFVFEPQDKIVLDKQKCNTCGDIEVVYYSYVNDASCNVDRILLDRYKEDIINGTAGKLRKMAGFAWSIPALGQDLMKQYEAGRAQAAIEATQGFITGSSTFDNGGW
jgi:hypothetical protein